MLHSTAVLPAARTTRAETKDHLQVVLLHDDGSSDPEYVLWVCRVANQVAHNSTTVRALPSGMVWLQAGPCVSWLIV